MKEEEYLKALHDTLDFSIYIGHNIYPQNLSVHDEMRLLKIHLAALLIRALTKAHAINVLFKNDLGAEANIVLRALLEIQFITCSIKKDEKHFERYLADIELQKFKELVSLDHAANYPECIFKSDEMTKAKISDLKQKFKGKQLITIKDHAEKAGMLGLYYSTYMALCKYVHSGPSEVSSHFHFTENSFVVARPKSIEYDLISFSGIEAMKNILNSIAEVFGIFSDKLQQLNDIYQELNGLLYRKYILRENIISK